MMRCAYFYTIHRRLDSLQPRRRPCIPAFGLYLLGGKPANGLTSASDGSRWDAEVADAHARPALVAEPGALTRLTCLFGPPVLPLHGRAYGLEFQEIAHCGGKITVAALHRRERPARRQLRCAGL